MIPEVHCDLKYEDIMNACQLLISDRESFVSRFESEFANYIDVPYAKTVSSGRSALYLAFQILGLKRGDEVLVPAYTSPIIPRVLLELKLKPIYIGVDVDSLNLNPANITEEITDRTKAIVCVHMFGNPCRNDEILEIASDYDLFVVEDAAQALGAEYSRKKVGSFGDLGLFSFGLGKNMTTMEGGMLVTRRKDLIERLELFSSAPSNSLSQSFQNTKIMAMMFLYPFIMDPKVYSFLFYLRDNFREQHIFKKEDLILRYNSLQAALGRLLLKKIDSFNSTRIRNANRIISEIQEVNCLTIPRVEEQSKSVFLRLVLRHEKGRESRESLRKKLLQTGFEVPSLSDYYLMPYLSYGKYSRNIHTMFENIKTEIVHKVLVLPTNPSLSDRDLVRLALTLKTYY